MIRGLRLAAQRCSLVLGVALLAGCAAAPAPAGIGTTVTPTPTPTAESLPDEVPAVLPFACADVVDEAAFGVLFGGVPPERAGWGLFDEAATRHRGVATCDWYQSDPYASFGIWVVTRHDSGLEEQMGPVSWTGELGPAESLLGCSDSPAVGYGDCGATAIVAGYQVSIHAGGGNWPDAATADQAMREAVAPMIDALAAHPAPTPWTPPAGAWPTALDCMALAAGSDVPGVAEDPSMAVSDVTGVGEDYTYPRAEAALWGETSCNWTTGRDAASASIWSVTLDALSGGGWLWRDLVPAATGVERVAITGADEAAFECVTPDSCVLLLRIGANAARVSGSSEYSYEGQALSREQLRALGATLAPALAAIR